MVVLNNLINSMEPRIATTIMIQKSAKAAWEFHATYALSQNICHIYQLYEKIFFLKQEERPIQKFYALLQGK